MTPSLFDPSLSSYGRAASRGAVVSGTAQGLRILCQIASVVVLSRLLSPADFGIVAMSWPVVGLLLVLQDFGLAQAAVQRPHLSERDVNFLFWCSVGIGLLVAALILVLAPLAAWFYGEPQVGPLVMAMSALVVVQALGAQHTALLNRMMRFGALAAMDVAAALANLAVAVALAVATGSYWALFWGSFAGTLTPTLLAWSLMRWTPGRPAGTEDQAGLVRFGAGMTGFTLANFFARNSDNILIGRYLGDEPLGLYDRAYKLLLLPIQLITNPLGRSMVPTLSRLTDQPDRYRAAFLDALSVVLAVTLPGIAALIVVADDLVPFLLGARWQESAVIFQLLGFASLLQPLNNPSGWLFISQGRSADFARWGIFSAAVVVSGIALGLGHGIRGVAFAYAVSEYIRTPLLWLFVGRKGAVGTRDVIGTAGPWLLGAHLAVLILWLGGAPATGSVLLDVVVAALLAYGIVGMVVAPFPVGRRTLRSLQRLRSQRGVVSR